MSCFKCEFFLASCCTKSEQIPADNSCVLFYTSSSQPSTTLLHPTDCSNSSFPPNYQTSVPPFLPAAEAHASRLLSFEWNTVFEKEGYQSLETRFYDLQGEESFYDFYSLGGILVLSISIATTLTMSTFEKWNHSNLPDLYLHFQNGISVFAYNHPNRVEWDIWICIGQISLYLYLCLYLYLSNTNSTHPNRAVKDIWTACAKGDQADALALQFPEH